MGNQFCMTTPNTAAATGTPVKLLTYAGVPLDALVAYERAALDLPHHTDELQRGAAQQLEAAVKRCLEQIKRSRTDGQNHAGGSGAFDAPFFSLLVQHSSTGKVPTEQSGASMHYRDGVPVWLQEVALLWDVSSARRHSRGKAVGPSSSHVLRAEEEAVWANETSRLLRDFAATQKFAKALQHSRKALKTSVHGGVGSAAESMAAPQLPTSPLVFAELLRSYDALCRSLGTSASSAGGAGSSSSASLADTPITAGMWCVLLCRFLRCLPESLIPALCSRRLEPVLAPAGPHKAAADVFSMPRVTAFRVVRDSFVAISAVEYTTCCFVLDVLHRHRSELTGGEVEAVADALLRETSVPHVLREVAHACKPEARMFWPIGDDASVLAVVPPHGNSVTAASPSAAIPQPLVQTQQDSVKDGGKTDLQTEGAAGADEAARVARNDAVAGTHRSLPDVKPRGDMKARRVDERRAAGADSSSSSSSDIVAIKALPKASGHQNRMMDIVDSEDTSTERSSSESHAGHEHPPQPSPGEVKTKSGATAIKAMQWHEDSSSSSLQDENTDSEFDEFRERNVTAEGAPQPAALSPPQALAKATAANYAAKGSSAQPVRSGDGHDIHLHSPAPADSTSSHSNEVHLPPPPPKSATATRMATAALTANASARPSHTAAASKSHAATGPSTRSSIFSAAPVHETLSLAEVSPVRRGERSFLSRQDHDDSAGDGEARTHSSPLSALLTQQSSDAGEKFFGVEATLPSALVSQPEPTPLQMSRSRTPLYPSALEDAGAEETAAEALRRALQPFDDLPSAAATATNHRPSPSPSPDGSNGRLHSAHRVDNASAVLSMGGSALPLASSPGARVLLTPRDELQLQQARQEQNEQQAKQQPPYQDPSDCVTSPVARPMPTTRSTPSLMPYRTCLDHPLQAALLEAKQRFLAAPTTSLLFDRVATKNSNRSAPIPFSDLENCHGEGPTTTTAAATTAEQPRAAALAGGPPNLSSLTFSATLPEARRVQAGNGSDRRVSVRSPPKPSTHRQGPLSDTTRRSSGSTSASFMPLEATREFRKSSVQIAMADEGGQRGGVEAAPRSRLDTTRGSSLRTPSVDEDANDEKERSDRGGANAYPRSKPSGSSLSTPVDTALTTANASALSRTTQGQWTSLEQELHRLRDVVRSLESRQFVQAREAAAQTSALTAQCADLQRQQHEQEQYARFARARLADVGHALEDLRDDKARLQMQLTTARQEGAKLRDALMSGKLRA